MSLTLTERVESLETRLDLLEIVMNDIQTVISKLATTEQVRQINIVRQQELTELVDAITLLRTRCTTLENKVYRIAARR